MQELEELGAPDDYKQDFKNAQGEELFEVFEENWTALTVFLRLNTQWNIAEGVARGLNYQSLKWVIELHAPDQGLDVFEKVRVMELAALEVMNRK